MDNQKILYHTVTIVLPEEIDQKIDAYRKKLIEGFNDQYNYLAAGSIWKGHLALSTLQINRTQGEEMLRRAKQLCETIKPFELTLGEIVLSPEKKYIFLNLNGESEKYINELYNKFFETIDPIRNGVVPEKFMKYWDTYSEEEKQLLIKTGNKYSFTPHFSLAKMNPEEAVKAIKQIDTHYFEETRFTVNSFDFTIQDEVKENEFPVAATIDLL